METRHPVLQIANIAGFLGLITVNVLANALPINGKSTGELSGLYPNLFVPAGLTFSIWGLIYLLLAVFAVYQARTLFRPDLDGSTFLVRIGWLFFASCLLNMGWIFAWHYRQVLFSVLVMLALLGTLIAVYLRLGIGLRSGGAAQKLCVHLPFSVYLGWITIATVANITAFLVHAGWNRFGLSEVFWTILMIAVTTALALAVLSNRRDVFYALVVVWAFLGIILKQTVAGGEAAALLVPVLWVCIAVLLVGAALRLRGWLRY